MSRRRFAHSLAFTTITLGVPFASAAAPGSEQWSSLVRKTVTAQGWVDYAALKTTQASALADYLARIAVVDVQALPRNERIAFWINAYNAVCIKLLIDAGTPEEVPHSRFFGKNIFTERRYRVAGAVRSLDDIEHDILRKKFKEPRLHAALVCGASSCPRLRNEAYVGSNLDAQLNDQVRHWIRASKTKQGRRKNLLDRKNKVFFASKIFDWYEEDFGDSDQAILRFIARYASPSDRRFLSEQEVALEFLDYDWHLNSQ